jgi:hypothetical protein
VVKHFKWVPRGKRPILENAIVDRMADEPDRTAVTERASDAPAERPGEPPVVARLLVEIRSDGSRTIARGALEDLTLGQRAAVQAEGRTPLELMLSLARAMVAVPTLARGAVRALLSRGGGPGSRK